MKLKMLRRGILFVFLAYFLLGNDLPSVMGAELTAPRDVTWSIEKEHVTVRWRRQHKDEPLQGYFVSVREVLKGRRLSTPKLVHVKRGVRIASVRGLKPRALYEIKVVAYSGKGRKSSAPVIVKTNHLKFVQAYNLTVSSITATSVVFHWKHNPRNNIHDVHFKLICSGVQRFTRDGEEVVERTEIQHISPSTSQRSENYQSEELKPNTRYSCRMISVAGKLKSRPTTVVDFATTPGKPSPPPPPKVSAQMKEGGAESKSITVELYPTDNQFGPISYYKVFAVPVRKEEGQPDKAAYTPTVPVEQIPSHAISFHLVSEVSDPIPFIIGQYSADALPESLTLDGRWMKAFKSEIYYSIVVSAFTKTANKSEPLHSFSKLADPVYIATDTRQELARSPNPASRRFSVIVLSTLLSVIGVITLSIAALLGTGFYRSKMRDQYFFTVADPESCRSMASSSSSSSRSSLVSSTSAEEEIYQKPETTKQKPSINEEAASLLVPLSPPAPYKTLAEWGLDNIPPFDRSWYYSPEGMQEFDTTLRRIRMNHNRRVMAMLKRKYPGSNEVIQMEADMLATYTGMEPSTTETARPNGENPHVGNLKVTPDATPSKEHPLPQLHKNSIVTVQPPSSTAKPPPSPVHSPLPDASPSEEHPLPQLQKQSPPSSPVPSPPPSTGVDTYVYKHQPINWRAFHKPRPSLPRPKPKPKSLWPISPYHGVNRPRSKYIGMKLPPPKPCVDAAAKYGTAPYIPPGEEGGKQEGEDIQ